MISAKGFLERHRSHLDALLGSAEEFAVVGRYVIGAGGHQFRPRMAHAVFTALADPQATNGLEPLVALGTAVELLHTASLLLDDMPAFDDAKLRRGKPCAHLVFGEVRVLESVIWLSDRASFGLRRGTAQLPVAIRDDLLDEFHATKTEMLRGELFDVESDDPMFENVIERYRLKSGALYGFVCAASAVLARRYEHQGPLQRFGFDLGIAYQLADDILDMVGPPAMPSAKDLNKDAHKPTIPRQLGIDKARDLVVQYKRGALKAFSEAAKPTEPILEIVEELCRS
jgi:geranylgeranyl pyrophosphate synthase